MALPIRTTVDDVAAVCGYLATKPTGATLAEAKAVIDATHLDGRKLSAFKFWGLIEDASGKFKLTELGRKAAKDKGVRRSEVLREVISKTPPYAATIERVRHREEYILTATEVAAQWHEHFPTEVSDSDKILNDQAVCFFQLAEGADLGAITVGRKGQLTRFSFNEDAVASFVSDPVAGDREQEVEVRPLISEKEEEAQVTVGVLSPPTQVSRKGNRVFITHGKNKKILDQVKEIVAFGKFEPVVAQEHETVSKPVPDKVLDDMRTCQAAVIHVGSEGVLLDDKGKPHTRINGNVLIEIGAAMALYGRNFILLVEEGVELPSNLQGLYECRYKGDNLDGAATMKLLKAFNEFK